MLAQNVLRYWYPHRSKESRTQPTTGSLNDDPLTGWAFSMPVWDVTQPYKLCYMIADLTGALLITQQREVVNINWSLLTFIMENQSDCAITSCCCQLGYSDIYTILSSCWPKLWWLCNIFQCHGDSANKIYSVYQHQGTKKRHFTNSF